MKKSHLPLALQFIILFCFTTSISLSSIAQSGPNPPRGKEGPEKMKRDRRVTASPITVLGNEHLERTYSLSAADLKQTITYTPSHTVTNATTVIRGIGNGATNTILVNDSHYGYINNSRRMIYSRSNLIDLNNRPIAVIEQLNVVKGSPGIQYGSDALSGVVNFTYEKDRNTRFPNDKYIPYYTPPTIEYPGTGNQLEINWKKVVEDAFESGEYSSTLPDDTYGNNGSLYINAVPNNDFLIETKDYIDGNNNVRLSIETEYYPEGYGSQETKYWDGCGNIEFAQLDLIDHYGNKFNQLNIKYNYNKPEYGYFQPDKEADFTLREWYDLQGDIYHLKNLKIDYALSDYDLSNYNYQQSTKPCKEKEDGIDNVLSFDLSFRLEDFGIEKKVFPGANVSYTRVCKPWIGATADASVNFGKVNDTNYTIFSAYAGPTFFPFSNSHGLEDPVTLTAHTLAGYTNVSQKFSGNSNSFGDFSLKLGIGGMYNINDEWGIGLQANNNMVLTKGNTTNNLSFELGIRYKY